MRRAIVIKMTGDAEIGGTIVDAIESSNMPVPANGYTMSAKMGIRAATGFKDWKSLLKDLYSRYGFADEYEQHNVIADKMILAWALVCTTINECYKRLSDWNRRG